VISVNTCSELTAGVLLGVMLPDQYYLTIKNDSSAILSSGRGGLDSGNNLVTRNVHEGRQQLSQGWHTGSTLIRAAKATCNVLRGEEPGIKRGLNLARCL
jgi:hypothetical protein